MSTSERRRYSRHETELAVTIHKDDEKIPVTMINISNGGIGIISERGFFPGTKVLITPESTADYSIQGAVKWARLIDENGNSYFRIGAEADSFLLESESHAAETTDRSEIVKRLLQKRQRNDYDH